ncbi:c-type cytochrome biogenesis protein CcmI [Haematobacter genomosp. 1]|uniref:C-type cytochrome biogenesis protein CcmI n=1 Tax=Haematobacter genomosp. 1 TaxID=366618 RepID=A0A212AGL0_9RHOB|nr:c-type cytochrome biogenesis protein CcmI [Haematobacter genomosp. 1]OWJ80604.1 c-type cytochrome biogenesis protein CcmI [Haematobacter genomosp. 1]
MPFWIAAATLTLAIAVVLLLSLRSRREEDTEHANVRVYRDQLREVERDLERGTLPAAEAGRLRTEISRRLLEADRETEQPAGRGAPLVAGLAVILLLAAGFGLYLKLGAPDYPDMPLASRYAAAAELKANRPTQAQMEAAAPPLTLDGAQDAAFLDLMEKLRAAVHANPDDLRGQQLLARNEAALGRFSSAAAAQSRVVTLKGSDAAASDYADLADYLILAAGGGVSSEAEAALTETLRRDPQNPAARFYSGLMLAQTGRPDLAFRLWSDLLETSPPGSPWIPAIRQDLPRLALLAGVDYTLPPEAAPPIAGPSAADISAADDMTPQDRDAMVRGMVDRLSDRLSREGGPPEDWARLISSLGVLGEGQKAAAVWAEAQEVFAGRDSALAPIRDAAEKAGVTGL